MNIVENTLSVYVESQLTTETGPAIVTDPHLRPLTFIWYGRNRVNFAAFDEKETIKYCCF